MGRHRNRSEMELFFYPWGCSPVLLFIRCCLDEVCFQIIFSFRSYFALSCHFCFSIKLFFYHINYINLVWGRAKDGSKWARHLLIIYIYVSGILINSSIFPLLHLISTFQSISQRVVIIHLRCILLQFNFPPSFIPIPINSPY